MFKGSNVALITPFKDNVLDEEKYINLINFQAGDAAMSASDDGP